MPEKLETEEVPKEKKKPGRKKKVKPTVKFYITVEPVVLVFD
jgi:hypothetical protein